MKENKPDTLQNIDLKTKNQTKDITAGRRRLLKVLMTTGGVVAAGQSLPQKWVKPAVDAALLPAHAQTSVCNVECAVGISLSWGASETDLVDLRVETPGGTMIDPKGVLEGQCMAHEGDVTGQEGTERVSNINAPYIGAGTYRIFVRKRPDGYLSAALRVTTCDDYDSVAVCLATDFSGEWSGGTVVVNADGSTQINLNSDTC